MDVLPARRSTLGMLLLLLVFALTGGLASTSPPGWARRQRPPAPPRPAAPRLVRADGDTGLDPGKGSGGGGGGRDETKEARQNGAR